MNTSMFSYSRALLWLLTTTLYINPLYTNPLYTNPIETVANINQTPTLPSPTETGSSELPLSLQAPTAKTISLNKIEIISPPHATPFHDAALINPETKSSEPLYPFSYTDEDLVTIINHYAALTNNNIILPQGAHAIKEKVTIALRDQFTLNSIWNTLLPTILDLAGYSINKRENTYVITKNDREIGREPAPLYIGISPEKLPDSDMRIRYLYYFSHIKVAIVRDILQTILTGLLPSDALFEMDPTTNAIFIAAKANDIKGAMRIIAPLDQTDFHETMEIIRLKYTLAHVVATLFNDQILRGGQERDRYRLDTRKEPRDNYFSEATKIIPEPKSNSLIVLGRPQAINRIKQFIYHYIDVELASGQSILHVYQLQYLDAEKLVPTLDSIIKSQGIGGTGQSRANQEEGAGGIERSFESVIIRSDQVEGGKGEKSTHFGGNKLIIAARHDDWMQIKKLIERLDIPQPQVLIEVLIADLSVSDARELGSITRNPLSIPFPGDASFQSAHFGNIIVGPNNADPRTLQSDLLRSNGVNMPNANSVAGDNSLIAAGGNAGNLDLVPSTPPSASGFTNAALVPSVGATVISLNDRDGQTWSLLQVLNKFTNSKILSHPHVIATHNMPAFIRAGEVRLLPDEASGSTGGAGVQRYREEEASLKVTITPRITGADLVNLEIMVDIDQFISPQDNTRITRHFNTNANVANGNILALGGLIKKINSTTEKETPILGKIPLLGWFFKDRTGGMEETNLTVFILPTIIEPRLRPGIGRYTEDYVTLAQQYAQEGELFNNLKDPVTRWFFKTDVKAENILNNFLTKDEFKLDIATLTSQQELAKNVSEPESDQVTEMPASSELRVIPNKLASTTTSTALEKPFLNKTESSKNIQNDHLKQLFKDTENPLLTHAHKTPVAPAA